MPQSEETPDKRWWAVVVPTNGDISPGRYGYWDDKPKETTVDGILTISGKPEEPELHFSLNNVVSVFVGQYEHLAAAPRTTENAKVN